MAGKEQQGQYEGWLMVSWGRFGNLPLRLRWPEIRSLDRQASKSRSAILSRLCVPAIWI